MQVSPSQISPGEPFDIFYFIRNWTDNATYYVRAVVYDVRTGAVLSTTNLDQSSTNARLFIKTMQSPPDPVGTGRNVVAIASVYTDSSYTTKSDAYEEQEQYYLIKSVLPFLGGGGSVDYRVIREMLQEVVAKGLDGLPKPQELNVPDAPDMSFVDALFGTLGALQKDVNRIPKKGADFTNLTTKLEALDTLLKSRPAFEKTDLSPLSRSLDDLSTKVDALREAISASEQRLTDEIDTHFQEIVPQLVSEIGAKVEETIHSQELELPMTVKVKNPRPSAKADQPSPIDVSHLMKK